MALTVSVRSGEVDTPLEITFDAPRIVIGRGEGCEVKLPDPSVSHRHASIRQRGSEYIVLDEGSTNGTFVGPVRLPPQAPRVLRSGDLVRVGRVWLEIRIEQAVPTQNAPQATKEIALALVAKALAAQGETAAARVRVVEGPAAGAELLLTEVHRPYVVGRGKGLDLTVDDADLSRRHVELVRRGDRLCARDLGSKNGSKIGDRALSKGEEAPWAAGEALLAGKTRLVYDDPVREALAELERAADEQILGDEIIDPPTGGDSDPGGAEGSGGGGAGARGSVSAASSARPRTPSRPDAPIAAMPRRAAAGAGSQGWGPTDFLVALVALAVLGASVLALWWLLKAG